MTMTATKNEFTLGSDVEFFLMHGRQGAIPATAFNTPGSKSEPVRLTDECTFHRDNVSVELQPQQADNPDEWMRIATESYDALSDAYRPRGLSLVGVPTIYFPHRRLDGLTEAMEIGCEPDICAYTGTVAPPTSADIMGSIRTASGHLHIGYMEEESYLLALIRWMDVLEGLPFAPIDYRIHRARDPLENRPYRRAFYGQAGRCRLKPYGIEWRTPSVKQWLSWQEGGISRVFASVHIAIAMLNAGHDVTVHLGEDLTEQVRQNIDRPTTSSRCMALMDNITPLLSGIPGWDRTVREARGKYGAHTAFLSS